MHVSDNNLQSTDRGPYVITKGATSTSWTDVQTDRRAISYWWSVGTESKSSRFRDIAL